MENTRIIIACDSFKGSATTIEVGNYIEQGIKKVDKNVDVVKFPIGDGGEGTVDSLVIGCNGEYQYAEVVGPRGKRLNAKFGMIEGNTAVIEMAEASGLQLIEDKERNPFEATTYGTGELIKVALDHGARKIYIGLGGSATNDGGIGMAQALGVSFKDKDGQEVGYGANGVRNIATIDTTNIDKRLASVPIIALSDVTNPLCGKNGASYIYGPQKGASEEDVKVLDEILFHYGMLIKEQLKLDIAENVGAGAAGGLGAGLMAFCNVKLENGITKILELIKLEDQLKDADLVITGEGKMDSQSLYGKAPIGVATLAKRKDVPVIAIVGSADYDLHEVYKHGIDFILDTVIKPMPLVEAISNVEKLLNIAGESAYRAFKLNTK
ncbi:glycerate kinase [Oceanobacillus halophilus]|uniref:Glycerate kinase n=1 Tax=Oceanobacillus halophilus TaxID=930130 RepID=A0A495A7L1_9BACI|nr:glycerate kinase [Oceanobacillus halophilus]RKQ34334.1 glycerate kinase [Oceanobacillus halophilus]